MTPPSDPFDFHDEQSRQEAMYMRQTFQRLKVSGVSREKAIDIVLEYIEEEGIDERVRRDVADFFTPMVKEDLKKTIAGFTDGRANNPHLDMFWLANVRRLSQQTIRISNIKGKTADRLLSEVAREVSALSDADRNSLGTLTEALARGYEQAQKPVPPKPKRTGGHFDI